MTTSLKSQTVDVIGDFEKIINDFTEKKTKNPTDILSALRKIRTTNPPVFKDKQVAEYLKARNKTLDALVAEFIFASLTQHYGFIDRDLFKLKRHIIVEGKKIAYDATRPSRSKSKGLRFEIPLFAFAGIEQNRVQIGGVTTKDVSYNEYGDRRTTTKNHYLHATVPEIPDHVRKLGAKAIGTYFKIIGEAHSHDDMCDLEIKHETPKLEVIWIPSPGSLNLEVKTTTAIKKAPRPKPEPAHSPWYEPDPALVMVVDEQEFLVTTWDAKNEEPFMNFLREFTTGIFPKE